MCVFAAVKEEVEAPQDTSVVEEVVEVMMGDGVEMVAVEVAIVVEEEVEVVEMVEEAEGGDVRKESKVKVFKNSAHNNSA